MDFSLEKATPMRGTIPDEEWCIQRLAIALHNSQSSDAYRALYENKEIKGDSLEFRYEMAKILAPYLRGEGVLVEFAEGTLIPGLREVNDELDKLIGKQVEILRNSASRVLTKVQLVDTNPKE